MEIQMNKKILLIMLIILAMTLGLASCGDEVKKVSALTVIDGSYTTKYTVGDTPDFSGIKAVVSYSDGSAETVGADTLTLGTVDTSSAGKKELTVKFDGFETKVKITVKGVPVSEIVIDNKDLKTEGFATPYAIVKLNENGIAHYQIKCTVLPVEATDTAKNPTETSEVSSEDFEN